MKHLSRALIVFFFALITASGFSKEGFGTLYSTDYQDTEITIVANRILIQNLPSAGKLYVYSVLGANVAIIDVKAGSGEYNVNLPKGYYIIKVGEIVRKVVAK